MVVSETTAVKISAFVLFGFSAVAALGASTSVAQTSQIPALAIYRSTPAWSGFYAGFNLGGHFTDTHVGVNNVAGSATVDLNRNGVCGGVHFGYGRQLGWLYVGGEADSAFGRLVSSHTRATSDRSLASTVVAHQRFVGTVRGKVGRPFGRLLVYGTGGLAIGGLEQGVSFNGPASASVVQSTVSRAGMEPGYAVGGGAEYTASHRFSYELGYLYYRLRTETVAPIIVPAPLGSGTGYSSTVQNEGDLLRVGANYRF